jgi:hypothetical protein
MPAKVGIHLANARNLRAKLAAIRRRPADNGEIRPSGARRGVTCVTRTGGLAPVKSRAQARAEARRSPSIPGSAAADDRRGTKQDRSLRLC